MKWLVLLLLLPGASAYSIALTEISEPLAVGGPAEALEVTVSAACSDLIANNPGQNAFEVAFTSTAAHPGIGIVGPQTVLLECQLPTDTASTTVDYFVYANPSAPGNSPLDVAFTAAFPTQTAESSTSVRVQPRLIAGVTLEERVQQASGSPKYQASYPGTITNHGNVPTRFLITSEPPMELPGPVMIGVGETFAFTAVATYEKRGIVNEQIAYNLTIAMMDPETDATGEPVHASAILRAKGGQAETAGFALLFLIPLAVVGFLAHRHYRSR
ncbi:MAG: hypothetical protein ACPHK8_07620, partial [Thermoplasmatota archaeon]